MLFLDGAYAERSDGSARFRCVKAPSGAELTQLAHTIAHRVGRFLERQGPLECDAENSSLSVEAGPMDQLLAHERTTLERVQAVHPPGTNIPLFPLAECSAMTGTQITTFRYAARATSGVATRYRTRAILCSGPSRRLEQPRRLRSIRAVSVLDLISPARHAHLREVQW